MQLTQSCAGTAAGQTTWLCVHAVQLIHAAVTNDHDTLLLTLLVSLLL